MDLTVDTGLPGTLQSLQLQQPQQQPQQQHNQQQPQQQHNQQQPQQQHNQQVGHPSILPQQGNMPTNFQTVQMIPSQFPIPPLIEYQPMLLAQDPRLHDQQKSSQYKGIINDRRDCVTLQRQYARQRRSQHTLQQPAQDPSENFPFNDPARQKILVGQLFLAIRNKTGLLDGQPIRDEQGRPSIDAMGHIMRRPDANTKRIDSMSDINVEMLCWDILYGLNDAHNGVLYAMEWTWGHSFNYERHETFMRRFEKVVELLRVSKRAVCDLLEASWLCRITNAPEWELDRKRRNKDGNAKKGDFYNEGKRRLQPQATTSGAEMGDDIPSEDVALTSDAVRSRKRPSLALPTTTFLGEASSASNFGQQQLPPIPAERIQLLSSAPYGAQPPANLLTDTYASPGPSPAFEILDVWNYDRVLEGTQELDASHKPNTQFGAVE